MTEAWLKADAHGSWHAASKGDPGARRFVLARDAPPVPTTLPSYLTAQEKAVLWAFCSGDADPEHDSRFMGEHCLNYGVLCWPGARLATRQLKRRGLLSFHRGLFTEDGEPAGAGYALTDLGRFALACLNLLSEEARW
jgi:hypothetical protein